MALPLDTGPVRRAHIVTIRKAGRVVGYQLRVGDGGPGKTTLFSVGVYGTELRAKRKAVQAAKETGLVLGRKKGGSQVGRRTSRSPTLCAGVRFQWVDYPRGPILYVVASWTNAKGRLCGARYSTESNGLEQALDRAIAARTSAGAPEPDRKALLKALRVARSSRA